MFSDSTTAAVYTGAMPRRLLRLAASRSRIPLLSALGLVSTDEDRVADAREEMLARTMPLWLVATALLVTIPLLLVTATLRAGLSDAMVSLAESGAPAVVLSLSCLAMLVAPGRDRVPPHRRIAAFALALIWIALSLGMMIRAASTLPPELRAPAQAALGGVAAITLIAATPVRIAVLAFTVTLALVTVAFRGVEPVSLVTAGITGALAAGLVMLARREAQMLRATGQRASADERAGLLVGEFESHGAGWFWQTDRTGALAYLSEKVAAELRGMGVDPLGAALTDVFRVDSALNDSERTLTFHLQSRTSFSDYSVKPADETVAERAWSISGSPMVDDLGRFQGFVGFGSDLTEKRRAEAEITRLALFDSLTGLANRQRMRLSLDKTLLMQSGGPTDTGLFLLDLDRFKAVNDTLGHQVGDELLKQVAARLQRTIGDAGLVGRLGGDEFQVVIPREGHRERLGALAGRVIEQLSQPYFIQGATVSIGCSIGIAIAPEHGSTPETLIRNADLALYAAKGDGRGVYRIYRDELLAGAKHRKQLEDDLRLALKHEQFHLTYQPVVSTADQRIVGYEALLRWDHPTRGAVSPADFVPVAEECGLIEQIGEWVLRTATREAANWPGHVRVAVNVSPIQFANPNLPSLVTNAIAAAGLPPGRLELEITEGVFLNEDASSEAMFRALKGIGVRLALDDFGTGYSSLGYLKKAPFDKIKIDQSFVRGAVQPGNRNAAIIRAIVSLAETLGMETTAEGVEQQDEIALIRDLGCSHIQGYVYGRPARADTTSRQLADGDGYAFPVGHKISRPHRHRVLRSARVTLGDETAEVRIRDLSTYGVMIDNVDLPAEAIGHLMRVELGDGETVTASIRWCEDGRAGLQFERPVDVDRLTQSAAAPRRTGSRRG